MEGGYGKKRKAPGPIDLDWDKLLPPTGTGTGDEEPPPLVVVKEPMSEDDGEGDSEKEQYMKLPQKELTERISRAKNMLFDKPLLFPDGGTKMRADLEILEAEFERRKLLKDNDRLIRVASLAGESTHNDVVRGMMRVFPPPANVRVLTEFERAQNIRRSTHMFQSMAKLAVSCLKTMRESKGDPDAVAAEFEADMLRMGEFNPMVLEKLEAEKEDALKTCRKLREKYDLLKSNFKTLVTEIDQEKARELAANKELEKLKAEVVAVKAANERLSLELSTANLERRPDLLRVGAEKFMESSSFRDLVLKVREAAFHACVGQVLKNDGFKDSLELSGLNPRHDHNDLPIGGLDEVEGGAVDPDMFSEVVEKKTEGSLWE